MQTIKQVRIKVLFLCILTIGAASYAGPINSNSAFSPHKGDSIWREQLRLLQASDDPTSMDRDLTVIGLNSVYIYGFTEKITGVLVVSYLDKSLDVTLPTGRLERGDNGFGDIRTFLKYRVYTNDLPGASDRLGLFASLEWPTGDDDETDSQGLLPQTLQLGSGSYDLILGLVWTTQKLAWELDIDLGYKLNTEANDFEFGDVLFYNISYQYRLWPRELPEKGVPSYIYAVLELNGTYAQKNENAGVANQNSGGHTIFMSR